MAEAIETIASIAQDLIDKEAANDPEIRKIMKIVHTFIKNHRVMCYGGTAINNILPKKQQFYNFDTDIPDYDFFSETPQKHAKQLSDILSKAGIENIEVKPGIHLGTFKVFANYTGVADISMLETEIFSKLWKESIEKDSIHYVPPNFLRMSMYLELSRPRGDVSRWKKVFKRLTLLNNEYPMECNNVEDKEIDLDYSLKRTIENHIIETESVLLGFNAVSLQQKKDNKSWSFPIDLLVTPEKIEHTIKSFSDIFKKKDIVVHGYTEYAELLPPHYDILNSKKELLIRIFQTDACHSYHETSNKLKLASIPTILNFFFAMLYADKHFLETTTRERLLCTCHLLVSMSNTNKRRFKLLTPISCIGTQKQLIDMKREKSELYSKLSKKKLSRKFLQYFFSYNPDKK